MSRRKEMVVRGSCGVVELQCEGVAVYMSCCVRQLRCIEIAVCGSGCVWMLWCGEIILWKSCGVKELQR